MASTAKVFFHKLGDLLPGFHFKKNAMANDDFKPTDTLHHRYQNTKVLTEFLVKTLHFKRDQIKIRTTKEKGLEVELPRQLKDEEIKQIHREFEDANERRLEPDEK